MQCPNLIKIILSFSWIITQQLSRTRSRGTHGRDHLFPLGNTGYSFVKLGNLLASRCCLLIYVAVSRGCRFVLEQPDGTSFPFHPRWQELIQYIQVAVINQWTLLVFPACPCCDWGGWKFWHMNFHLRSRWSSMICMYPCIYEGSLVNKYLTGHHHYR